MPLSTTFSQCAPEITVFGKKIPRKRKGHCAVRKLIHEFPLVINIKVQCPII